jgi:integrase
VQWRALSAGLRLVEVAWRSICIVAIAPSARFRHTFARILLERGVPVADVADLLGDDEKTVRDHYARWVPERQARLTKILKSAFAAPLHGARKPARRGR